jgi:hypothetical protein
MLVKRSRAAAIIRRKLILNFHFAPRAQLYKSADALLHIDVDSNKEIAKATSVLPSAHLCKFYNL